MTRPITTEQPWAELERLAKAALDGNGFDQTLQRRMDMAAELAPATVLALIASARANSVGTEGRSPVVDHNPDREALRERVVRLHEIASALDSLSWSNNCGATGRLAEEMQDILSALQPLVGKGEP